MLLWLLMITVCGSYGQKIDNPGKKWEEVFRNPPESTKPYVYWYWDNDNISKEGITKDLEAMLKIGIGEAMIGNVVGRSVPKGKVPIFSEEWWGCVEHAVSEANRLGVKVGMFNCPGWSQSGGPWVKPDQSMRYLVSNEVRVSGGQPLKYMLTSPNNNFQLVSVQAFPVPAEDNDHICSKSKYVWSSGIKNVQLAFDGDTASIITIPSNAEKIEIQLKKSTTVRSLQIIPADKPMKAEFELEAREKSGSWKKIMQFKIDRSNIDLAVGPMKFGPIVVSFKSVVAQEFRISFFNGKGAMVREIDLSGAARLTSYVEKQLGKMSSNWNIQADTYRYPESAEPENKSLVVDPSKVVDLKSQMDKNGTLSWDVPKGQWIISYTGMVPVGIMNSPTTPEGSGLEVDKMNKELAQFHFDSYIGELLKRIPAEKRPGLCHIVADSYEKGTENWTEGFAEDFKSAYGYDPYPWLPVLSGRIVASADRSERFLWDMRRLVADRIARNYVGGLRERCEQNGLRLWIENYGHWGFPGEFLNYGGASNDIGGEFWLDVPERGKVEVRCASSAGRTYGKKVISSEAFTSHWSFNQMPRDLKVQGDWAWCEGINHFVMHVYIHQPDERKPGISAWFGTDFNRHNTWFYASKSYFDYIRRSCALLQSGNSVADVAYFIGEDVPKMTGDREPALPKGYDYDFINTEILKNNAHVVDGRIVLSSGASYAVLVLPPQETMRPEVLERIATLIKEGACVLGNQPKRSPSGSNYPQCDSRIMALGDELWGKNSGKIIKRLYGKGHIFSGIDLKEVLTEIRIAEDCKLPEGLLYTHRQEGDAHFYFVSNQANVFYKDTMIFRVSGLKPELWNPVSGQMKPLSNYKAVNGKTYIPLEFAPGDSWFIVFRQKGESSSQGDNFPNWETIQSVQGNWNVDFKPEYAQPFTSTFTGLTDWSQNEDKSIKYFSGTATYKITFKYDGKKQDKLYLDLGQVEGMATIRLNGNEYPTLWRYPYRSDISGEIQQGVNKLEVDVVNCWWNRLVGDTQSGTQPVTWSAFVGWSANSKLLPSGILGPVKILSANERK